MTTTVQRSPAGPVNHPPGSVRAVSNAEYAAIAAATLAGTFQPQFGLRYMLTDGLLAGRMLEWNGESFGGFASQPIAQSFEPFSRTSANVAGDATAIVMQSVVIPPFLMRRNSKLKITVEWAFQETTSSKNFQIKFGGADIAAPNITNVAIETTKQLHEILAFNSYSAQRTFNSTSYSATGNPYISTGIETREPVPLDIMYRWGAATPAEVVTLIGFSLELLP